jgi:hypothetical protein
MFWSALLGLLMLYPLSMGPVLWAAKKMTEEFDNPHFWWSAVKIYEPLMTAADAVFATPLLQWYVQLFVSFGWGH